MQYTLSQLIKGLDVTLQGDSDRLISAVCPIQQAKPGSITFLTNALYRKFLPDTQASAVILSEADAASCPEQVVAVISRNPYYVYAKIAEFFVQQEPAVIGIHPTAVIGKDCQIDASASIGANCVIGNRVTIGAQAVIRPGCIIEDDVQIGAAVWLDAQVTLCHHVQIGQRTRIASGAVIGSEGFGFANQKGTWHKVPQLGTVEIGEDVDIGANTTIDRGAIENTVIGNGVKLDNQIQIAHNVKIGDHTIIAGCVGIAGSAVIGKYCMIGGSVIIAGHITIADQVMITAGTGVSKSIREPGMYSSGVVGALPVQEWRKNNARFYRLEQLMARVKALESTIKELTERQL
ncbi:MAG TPA: UDP-3-O-(3-hydroxymyristoyl)glucosamine N-acyltransferase [Gammaproteobacteria bacterium]|jgi:UDP-3-O-[3-hydroxymyristoyl] glucosamine N-acyltransferase|nr:UDP-3-O-(3-hydroxymyristoyl)glucosamine N-acyltransferase [Gammaproteobacteria bacterium]